MSALSKVTVSLQLEEGWANIELLVGDEKLSMIGVSRIFDPMDDFLRAGASAVRGVLDTHIGFYYVPHGWRWRLRKQESDTLHIDVRALSEVPGQRASDEQGELVFHACCDGPRFARSLLNAFWPWSQDQSEYERLWKNPFPERAFSLLQEAVST